MQRLTTDQPIASSGFKAWLRNDRARARRVAGLSHAGNELVDVLDDLDGAENYERWIVSLLAGMLGDRVLEVGAGSGNMTQRLAEGRTVMAVEPHHPLHSLLDERTGGAEHIATFLGSLAELAAESTYDSAVMINVLEHIDDDVDVLRQMRAAVRPGGYVAVFSPAFEPLYSEFDRRVGHVRRYTKATLGARFQAADLRVVENRYINLPGFFGWLLVARMLKKNPTDARRVETYDRYVVPWVRRIEDHVRAPFGQSILTIGQRLESIR